MEPRATLGTQAMRSKAGAHTWVQLWLGIQSWVGCPARRRVKRRDMSYGSRRHGNVQWCRNALHAFRIPTQALLYVGQRADVASAQGTLPKAAAHTFSATTARGRNGSPPSRPNIGLCSVSHVVATHLSYVCISARQLYLQCIMGATALYVSVAV